MIKKSFHDIELEAWSQRAVEYNDLFASISTQAIDSVLDNIEPLMGKKHLDIACGTGHLVAAAAVRGAISAGIDFAEPMIEIARATYPKAHFQVADASELPFDDQTFDAITCVFGLLHMENPQAAVNEAFRVLKAGGSFVFTLWYGPHGGNECQKVIKDALTNFATNAIELPDTWVKLRYADENACEAITRQAGFRRPGFQRLPIVWQIKSAHESVRIIDKLSIRSKMMIDRQPPSVRRQIYDYVISEIETHKINGAISLAWPALLTFVQKPHKKG